MFQHWDQGLLLSTNYQGSASVLNFLTYFLTSLSRFTADFSQDGVETGHQRPASQSEAGPVAGRRRVRIHSHPESSLSCSRIAELWREDDICMHLFPDSFLDFTNICMCSTRPSRTLLCQLMDQAARHSIMPSSSRSSLVSQATLPTRSKEVCSHGSSSPSSLQSPS